jgi:hypothetical protein
MRIIYLDLRHHAAIFVLHDVAVIHEAPQDLSSRKSDSYRHRLVRRYPHGVYVPVKRLRSAITVHHLEVDLMYVKDVHLVGSILDRPLFNIAKWDASVDPVVVEREPIDGVLPAHLSEDNSAKRINVRGGKVLSFSLPELWHVHRSRGDACHLERSDAKLLWIIWIVFAAAATATTPSVAIIVRRKDRVRASLIRFDEHLVPRAGVNGKIVDREWVKYGHTISPDYHQRVALDGKPERAIRPKIAEMPKLPFFRSKPESGLDLTIHGKEPPVVMVAQSAIQAAALPVFLQDNELLLKGMRLQKAIF